MVTLKDIRSVHARADESFRALLPLTIVLTHQLCKECEINRTIVRIKTQRTGQPHVSVCPDRFCGVESELHCSS
jgi:hypothetical protein